MKVTDPRIKGRAHASKKKTIPTNQAAAREALNAALVQIRQLTLLRASVSNHRGHALQDVEVAGDTLCLLRARGTSPPKSTCGVALRAARRRNIGWFSYCRMDSLTENLFLETRISGPISKS